MEDDNQPGLFICILLLFEDKGMTNFDRKEHK